MLHRFATFVAGCTVLLVLAGSLVTSTDSGLSVPDWPTTYGWNMFTFPPSKWVGGIFYEHGHRLVASGVGFLTIILALWLWRREPRPWVKRLGVLALLAVVTQGMLGGLTVLFLLPAPISIAHAALAEIFLCLTVTIALVTSPGWTEKSQVSSLKSQVGRAAPNLRLETSDLRLGRLRVLVTTLTGLIYLQILLGATMRHLEAGLAIPDIPLAFGRVLPPVWDGKIAIHFAHRVGALLVCLGVFATVRHIWSHHRDRIELVRPALLLTALVIAQIGLGAMTVLSALHVWINSLHVVCGAVVLATSLVIALRSWRHRFRVTIEPESSTRASISIPAGEAHA